MNGSPLRLIQPASDIPEDPADVKTAVEEAHDLVADLEAQRDAVKNDLAKLRFQHRILGRLAWTFLSRLGGRLTLTQRELAYETGGIASEEAADGDGVTFVCAAPPRHTAADAD